MTPSKGSSATWEKSAPGAELTYYGDLRKGSCPGNMLKCLLPMGWHLQREGHHRRDKLPTLIPTRWSLALLASQPCRRVGLKR